MAVDSGVSAIVIGEDQLKAVTAKNPRIKYEVAGGAHVSNMGGKSSGACTDAGLLLKLTDQATGVNKALLGVPRLVNVGNRVVFEAGNNYIEKQHHR